MRKILIAGVAALLMGTPSAANATQTWCAVVMKPIPDGWLALRENPDWRIKMITTLGEGDYLYVGSEQCWEGVCDTDKREWAHVAGVPRIDGKGSLITFGWVRRKYLQEFMCPEDQEADAPKTEKLKEEPAPGT